MVKQWPGAITPGSSFTGTQESGGGLSNYNSLTIMDDPRRMVEYRANAVAGKLRRDGHVESFDGLTNSLPYISKVLPWPTGGDAMM